MGKSKTRAGRIPKPRPEKGVSKKKSKKEAKKLKNRRGELLDTEKAAKLERDGFQRRERQQKQLALKRCLKLVEKLEEDLRAFKEPLPNAVELAEAFKQRKKDRLYGGARPWDSRAKSPHGCGYDMYECMDHCGDWENEPKPQDLLELHAGVLGDNEHTRKYCRALLDLGLTQQQGDDPEAAATTFRGLLESDKSDVFGARDRLLCALMDGGNLAEARALVEKRAPEARTARDLYSIALVEYIAWAILQEDDASEEVAAAAMKTALDANPYVAAFTGWNEAFQEIVNPEEDAQEPGSGMQGGDAVPASMSEEKTGVLLAEALQYCISDIMMWVDADGAVDWMCEQVADCGPSLETLLFDPLEAECEDGDSDDDDTGRDSTPAAKALALYRAVYARDVDLRDEDDDAHEEDTCEDAQDEDDEEDH